MKEETLAEQRVDREALASNLARLRSPSPHPPDLSVVLPVNAKEDLELALAVVERLGTYAGIQSVEVVLAVNNYPEKTPPPEIEEYRTLGLTVAAHPSVFRDWYGPSPAQSPFWPTRSTTTSA